VSADHSDCCRRVNSEVRTATRTFLSQITRPLLEEIVKLMRWSRRFSVLGACFFAVAPVALAQTSSRTEWTFDDVITTALAQHPLVEAARARIEAAKGGRQTAGAFQNPVATVSVENAGLFGHQLPFGVSRETSTYFTMPLEPLFQRGPLVKKADEDVKAAEADLTVARRHVALEAGHAFYRVALAQIALEAAEENRAGVERLVTYNQNRVKEGATPEIELIRAQVELDRTTTNVVLAEVDLDRSRADLWPYLGGDGPSTAFRVTLTAPSAGTAGRPLAEILARARQQRPELIAARARVAAAQAETEYQQRLLVRQVGGTLGFKNIGGGNSPVPGSNSWIAGISVPLPIFNQNRGEVQRTTAELTAARQDLAWQERTVTATVQGAHDAAARLGVQIARLQGAFLSRAQEADRITLAAYQEGAATLLQVLDTSRAFAEARLTFFRALFAERQNAFDLALAVGDDPVIALGTLHTSHSSPAGGFQGVSR
jgi:cobalt-zinc-cadmium efflux system outer membrane protein